MWGSQGWNQWALQPAMFNDVPHEQIDWAELAKQWIQMQQTPSESVPLVPPPLPPPHPPQVISPVSLPPPPPPPGHTPLISEEFPENNIVPLLKTPVPPPVMPEPFHSERNFENDPAPFVPKTADSSSFWNKPQWEASVSNDVDERLWAPPPVEPAAPLLPGKETFDYGHVHDNPPLAMQSIDYNHMSEFSYNQIYPAPTPAPAPEAPYDQYWTQVNATPTISPIFLKKERSTTNLPVEEETTQIDAAKRKQLPAWIRDGLEKMEQERLKRLEKERAAKENAEKMAKMDLLKNNLDLKDGSSTSPIFTKSKFDSDSETEENEIVESKRLSPVKRTPSPIEDMRTEEERKEELMLKVRRTLTEVLLSVTNSEMVDIAQEMYRKAVSKAPARQLATATSLSSVASGLRGLASYGTESDGSDDEEEDASDSDEDLYRKIKEKKRLFAQKEKKIIAELERKEYEEKIEAEREKMNNDKITEKKSSKDIYAPVKLEELSDNNVDENNDILNAPMQPAEQNAQVAHTVLPAQMEEIQEVDKSNQIKIEVVKPVAESTKSGKKEQSISSDSEDSSSSGTTSESGEKRRKKSHKEVKKSKSDLKKSSKKEKSSSKHSSRRRRSRSRDSESSEKHRRERSRDRKNSSSKKKKKYKRSDSSGSSSSSTHRKKRSSRYESSHSHRERRSRSYDDRERRRKRSVSPCRVHNKSNSRSSRSHRYSDDKYDRKYKDEKKYYEHRHSPSPTGHSSRLPRKYRSRSLSSESQSSGKKLKKYRNR